MKSLPGAAPRHALQTSRELGREDCVFNIAGGVRSQVPLGTSPALTPPPPKVPVV